MRGFIKFQRLYRRRLTSSAGRAAEAVELVWQEDREAKAAFERTFQSLVEKRQHEEALYNEIASTDASQFFSMAAYCRRPPKHRSSSSYAMSSTDQAAGSEEKRRIESAALKIQYAVRRWLHKKDSLRSTGQWTRTLLQHRISESRYMRGHILLL